MVDYKWTVNDRVAAVITVGANQFVEIDRRIDWCKTMNFSFFVDFHTEDENEYDFGYIDFCFAHESDAVLFSLKYAEL